MFYYLISEHVFTPQISRLCCEWRKHSSLEIQKSSGVLYITTKYVVNNRHRKHYLFQKLVRKKSNFFDFFFRQNFSSFHFPAWFFSKAKFFHQQIIFVTFYLKIIQQQQIQWQWPNFLATSFSPSPLYSIHFVYASFIVAVALLFVKKPPVACTINTLQSSHDNCHEWRLYYVWYLGA